MDECNVDYSAAKESMDRFDVSSSKLMHGINNHSGRTDDPYVDGAFILSAVVDDGLPIELHCITTLLEEKYLVLKVSRLKVLK